MKLMTPEQSLQEHAGLIALLARKYTWVGEREDLHQIALAAWAAGWEKADPERGEKSQKAYASRSVKNALSQAARRQTCQKRTARILSMDAPLGDTSGTLHDITPADTSEDPAHDELAAIRTALDKLTPTDRDLLHQVIVHRTPIAHLSESLNVARGTIYNRTTAALANLKRHYREALA